MKIYNFSKFVPGVATEGGDDEAKQKFDPKHINFVDEKDEYNPVQIDNTDANFEFDNENAIVVDFCPLVPDASIGLLGLFSQTSTPLTIYLEISIYKLLRASENISLALAGDVKKWY